MHRKSQDRRITADDRRGRAGLSRGGSYLRFGVLSAVMWLGSGLQGQDGGAPPGSAGNRARLLSPEIIKAVIQKLPKYTPPVAAKSATEPPTDEGKVSSHGVLHLPKLTVKERPPARPSDFELLTPKGRLDLALRTHPGLRVGNIFGMNNGIALAMQAEERRLEEKTALTDTVRRSTKENRPESKRLLRLIDDAFRGPNNDWATAGGPMK